MTARSVRLGEWVLDRSMRLDADSYGSAVTSYIGLQQQWIKVNGLPDAASKAK
jgi:hypothetical protein